MVTRCYVCYYLLEGEELVLAKSKHLWRVNENASLKTREIVQCYILCTKCWEAKTKNAHCFVNHCTAPVIADSAYKGYIPPNGVCKAHYI